MPQLQKLYDDLQDKGFTLIAINIRIQEADKAPTIRDYFRHAHLDFPVVLINSDDILSKYGVHSVPADFLIGSDGKVLWRSAGFDARLVRAKLARLGLR